MVGTFVLTLQSDPPSRGAQGALKFSNENPTFWETRQIMAKPDLLKSVWNPTEGFQIKVLVSS